MRKKLAALRVIIYFISICIFINIPLSYVEERSFCILYNLFDIKCIGCGTTRAIFNLFNLNIRRALDYNSFAVVWFQLVILLILQDIILIMEMMFVKKIKTNSYSIIERIFIALLKIIK